MSEINKHANTLSNSRNGVVLFVFIVITVFLIVISGFRPVGFDNDSLAYQSAVSSILDGQYDIKEPTFILLAWLDGFVFNNNIAILFITYALIAITIKMVAIYKYSQVPLMSLVIYLCMYFTLHDLTQIRVGAAAAFFLLAIPDLTERKIKPYLIKISIACAFHFSCIILFPLILFSNKRLNIKIYFLMPFFALAAVLLVQNMDAMLIYFFSYFPGPLGTKAIGYINNLNLGRFDNVNVFSKFSLCVFSFFIIYAVALIKYRKPPKEDVIYFKIMSVMLVVFYVFSSVPVLASRTFELFGVSLILSLPSLTLKIKQKYFMGCVFIVWAIIYFCVVNVKLLNFEVL